MSREILFRGKSIRERKWIEGSLIINPAGFFVTRVVHEKEELWSQYATEVDHSTVCQYTGLTDKSGKKIFEGDILKANIKGDYPIPYHENVKEVVLWDERDKCFCVREEDNKALTPFFECVFDDVEIIGNIFDNPELLEGRTGEDD